HFSRVRGPMRPVLRPRSSLFSFAIAAALALSSERAFAQAAVITGRVTSDAGIALQGANVFITELNVSVGSSENGQYTITIPPARISGQTIQRRVRSVGFLPQARPLTLAAGTQTVNFALKADINRLSEVVVTGTVGGATERAKVPYAITQLAPEDMPVPALD